MFQWTRRRRADGGKPLSVRRSLRERSGESFDLQSCFTIPVTNESGMLGAMAFGSDHRPAAFTQRGERIVSGIAAQAAAGLEKARLFEKVQGSNAARDRCLALLSHELRTPLNPRLAIVSSLVADARLPSRAAGYIEHLTGPIDFALLTLTIDQLLTAVK